MTDTELLELKKQLQANLSQYVKRMIEVKGFNATCIGVACGVSKHGNDSVFIDVLADKPNSHLIVKLTIHFMNNLNELFEEDGWQGFGSSVPKNLSPLNKARCRILRAVFLAIRNLNHGQLDHLVGRQNNRIEALYKGHLGVASYTRGV